MNQPKLPTPPAKESRFLPESVEFRAAEGDKPAVVSGYAAKYNVESENLGSADWQFREIILPGAFDDRLLDDVRALFNHESSAILARSKDGKGTLSLSLDDVGLRYEFEVPNTQAGRDLVEMIKRGDVDQSSFSFQVDRDGQDWEEKQEGDGPTIIKRYIKKIARLIDVSPVTFPAYPDATVALRSFEQYQAQQEPGEARSGEENGDQNAPEPPAGDEGGAGDGAEDGPSPDEISLANRRKAWDLLDRNPAKS